MKNALPENELEDLEREVLVCLEAHCSFTFLSLLRIYRSSKNHDIRDAAGFNKSNPLGIILAISTLEKKGFLNIVQQWCPGSCQIQYTITEAGRCAVC